MVVSKRLRSDDAMASSPGGCAVRVAATVAAFGMLSLATAARAQVANLPPTQQSAAGWTFAITPYAWLPTVSTTYSYTGPRGAFSVTNTISAGVGDYISEINFGLMLGGEARYGRFTIMTDLVYANASITTNNSHFSSVNLGLARIEIPRELQVSTGTRLATTVWSLAGGYTLLQGDWGNLDAVAGLRMLFIGATTNYQLASDILLPDQTVGLSRSGTLNLGVTKPEGIGGVTGRINIPNSKFYLPFYLDAGGGSVPFTWQVYGGVAWQPADWVDVSVGYRYLAFQGGSKTTGVEEIRLRGVLLAGNFHF
jgi:opacity protein-like surface antigen